MNFLTKYLLPIIIVGLSSSSYAGFPREMKLSSELKDLKTIRFNVSSSYGELKAEVHYRKADEHYAAETRKVLMENAAKLMNYFEHAPEEVVHFIVQSDKTSANGSATIFPTNIVNLIDFPPSKSGYLNSNYDFNKGLILHELVHILHLSQTRGFARFLENIFGSVGKVPAAIGPRWFSEGVATWAETEFTEGGRLKDELLNYEVDSVLAAKDFCKGLGCMDNPGEYPGGSSSYWIGGNFIHYIELAKPGAVRCLVKKSSGSLAVFLNSTFKACTGMSATRQFEEFRIKRVSSFIGRRAETQKLVRGKKVFESQDGRIIFNKNFQIIGDNFYSFLARDRAKRLLTLDLKTGERSEKRFDNYFDEILTPTAYDKGRGQLPLSLFKISDLKEGKSFQWLGENKELSSPKLHYSFAFRESKDVTYYLHYENQTWYIYKNEKKFWVFPKGLKLQNPRLVSKRGQNSEIIFQSLYKERFRLESVELSKLGDGVKRRELYSSSKTFRILENCDDSYVLGIGHNAFGEKRKFIEVQDRGASTFKRSLSSKELDDLVDLRWNDRHTVFLLKSRPAGLITETKSCREQLKRWRKGSLGSRPIKILKTSETAKSETINEEGEQSYPSMRHFLPHYWYPTFSFTSDSPDYVAFNTSLSDPMGKHSLSLNPKYYTGLEEIAPNASYSYRLGDNMSCLYGCWSFGLVFDQEYDESSISSIIGKSEILSGGISYLRKLKSLKSWSYSASATVAKIKESDFLSTRENIRYRLKQSLSFPGRFYDDFFRAFSIGLALSYYDNKFKGNEFFGGELDLSTRLQIAKDTWLKLSGVYSLLDKNSFDDGVIFGGGSFGIHQLYGIGSSDVYGNEVYSLKAELDYTLIDFYRGESLAPIYMRRLSLIGGTTYLKGDVQIVDNVLDFDEGLYSVYAGARGKLTLYYGLPLDIDLVMASVKPPSGASFLIPVISLGSSLEF